MALLGLSIILSISACGDSRDRIDNARTTSVSIANLNVLHGFNCDPPTPADGDQCRVTERIALLREHLIAAGCPDLVTLQEIVNKEYVQRSPTERAGPLESVVTLLEAELPNLTAACGFTYQLIYEPFLPAAVAETDEELVLSRYPVLHTETRIFHSALYDEPGGFLIFARHVLYARVDHPSGEVDVYTTHLSSGSDAASNNCNSFRELLPGTGIGPRVSCPLECDSNDTVRACQAEQLALYVEQTRGANNLALITGDFNAEPGSAEYLSMTSRGWIDSHLAAHQDECDATTGIGCTGGRDSSAESLENPALVVDRRIDYIFAALPEDNNSCMIVAKNDQAQGSQGAYKISSAGIFAGEPNPFVQTCGPAPNPMCWVSDHSGNHTKLDCTY
jgi:endonuclease/exonuclease/phosphatase family metal-dependent hydrolase